MPPNARRHARSTVVAPFFGYSRQDKKHPRPRTHHRQAHVHAHAAAGADRVMTVDLHAAQEQGFFNGPVDHLTAMPILLDYMRDRLPLDNTTIVSPDAGRIKVSEQWAAKLGGLPLAFIHKTRDTTRPNHAEAHGIIGEVKDRDCVVIDDMIDTAGTICEAVRTLHDHGAKSVTLVATHGLLSGPSRGATQGQRRQGDRAHRHGADPRGEAPAQHDGAVCGPIARRWNPLRVRTPFGEQSAQRTSRGHAHASHLRLNGMRPSC